MSNYREMYEDIAKREREEREHPEWPLLRERARLIRELGRVERELQKMGFEYSTWT